jgi:hypothetical protein
VREQDAVAYVRSTPASPSRSPYAEIGAGGVERDEQRVQIGGRAPRGGVPDASLDERPTQAASVAETTMAVARASDKSAFVAMVRLSR